MDKDIGKKYIYHLLNGTTLRGELLSFTAVSNTVRRGAGKVATIPWTSVAYREDPES